MIKTKQYKPKKLLGGVIRRVYADSNDTKGKEVEFADQIVEDKKLNPMYYRLNVNYNDPTGDSDTITYMNRIVNNNASTTAQIRKILRKTNTDKFDKQEKEQFEYRKTYLNQLSKAQKDREKEMEDERNDITGSQFWQDFGTGFKEGLGNTLNYGGQAVSFIPGMDKIGQGISEAGQAIQNYGSEPNDEEITEEQGGNIRCKVCNKIIKKANWKKHKQSKIHGAGLISWMKNKYNQIKNTVVDKFRKKLDGFNNTSTATLKKYGDYPIVALRIFKKPIHKVLNLFINALTFGKFEELKKKYSFDDMYHLGVIASVRLNDGTLKEIQFEKVEAVKFYENVNVSGDDVEFLIVPLPNNTTTLNMMTEKARMAVGDKTYFDYSAFGKDGEQPNNCQWFVKYNLQNGLNVWNDKIEKFVMQDVSEIKKEMPEYAKDVMNTITDMGQIADNLMGGKLTIHRVNINKQIPFEQALKHAQSIMKTRRKFKEKIVGNHYHFRSKPKTKFKPRSWKTKKVNDSISIVFGELKD